MSFATINTPEMSRSVSVEELQADRKLCADIATDALSYVLRDLQSPEGGYYGAEAADSAVLECGSTKGKSKNRRACPPLTIRGCILCLDERRIR